MSSTVHKNMIKKKISKSLTPIQAVIVLLLLGGALYFIGDPFHPTTTHDVNKSKLRSGKKDTSIVATITNDDGDDSTAGDVVKTEEKVEDEGSRIFTFELSNLKDGKSGTIKIRTRPSWAKLGAEHFHKLIDDYGFYDECRFFRVVPNFIVQFGINGDPKIQSKAKKVAIKDDEVKETNARGTLTFATSGPNTRTTQLFINTNTNGNKFLDKQGFSPFAEVIEGMEYVDQINDMYKEKPQQGMIQNKGNAYLTKEFPELSFISKVTTK